MCLSQGSVAVKKLMTTATPIKENISLGAVLQFRGLVYYRHGGKHGSMQSDKVVENLLRVLHPDLQAEGRERHSGLGIGFLKTQTHSQ